MASPIPSHLTPSTPGPQIQSRPRQSHPSPNGSPAQSVQSSFGSPRSGGSPRTTGQGSVDVDSLLRHYNGDIRRALEAVAADRTGLQAQNAQLWKLIERQRAQCASLMAENDRLRSDKERANAKLSGAGLEPVASKTLSNSSSAIGLGFKMEQPAIRRHNSDREDKPGTTLQVPTSSSSAQSSPISTPASMLSNSSVTDSSPSSTDHTKALLPPLLTVQDRNPRRESRMAFPSEVSRMMALADSPREQNNSSSQAPSPAVVSSARLNIASSSSSSPAATSEPSVPPPSSFALATTTGTVHEEPDLLGTEDESDQAALHASNGVPPRKASLSQEMSMKEFFGASSGPKYSSPSEPRSSEDQETPRQSTDIRSHPPPASIQINSYLLPHTRLAIVNSTIFPNAAGREVLCFIVSVTVRPPIAQPVSWSVAKLFSAFLDLDTKVRAKSGRSRKEWKSMVAPLPDAKAWKDFAPSKIDQRKTALEAYIQSLLVAPLSDKSDLCEFLNADRVLAKQSTGRKEGYLTKKGKNFGGWKTRYFVVDGPVMEYYESRGGTHLGSIVIYGAQIGRQNRPSESSDEKDYRHAFLIIEQVKKGGSRHVLCAESDMERDEWIEVLCKHVDPETTPTLTPQTAAPPTAPVAKTPVPNRQRKTSKDVVVTAAQPMSALNSSDSKFGGAPSPRMINDLESKKSTQPLAPSPSVPSLLSIPSSSSAASLPSSLEGSSLKPAVIPNSQSADLSVLAQSPQPTPRANKRQSKTPNRPSHSAAYLTKLATDGMSRQFADPSEKERDRKVKSGRFWSFGRSGPEKVTRRVFGIPLEDSIAVASKAGLPAVVFRCIEWLEAKHAEREEGLYRLSGSSAVIKALAERFDVEGDIDLLKVDEDWDPHAIGGLLKAYLRALPQSLLTLEMSARFLAVLDLVDPAERIADLTRLVSELPPANYTTLRALTAHIILIVRNQAINKMTLRNIAIVFAPTLGVPAGVFSEFVYHFGAIFDDEPPAPADGALRPNGSGQLETVTEEAEETMRRKRNSLLYQAGGADAMLGLSGRSLDPALEDANSEDDGEDVEVESESHSLASGDTSSLANSTPRADAFSGAPVSRVTRPMGNGAQSDGPPMDSPTRAGNGGSGAQLAAA